MAGYIKKRAFDRGYFKAMVVDYLKKRGKAKRVDIDKLLISKVSDALTQDQKKQFTTNLL